MRGVDAHALSVWCADIESNGRGLCQFGGRSASASLRSSCACADPRVLGTYVYPLLHACWGPRAWRRKTDTRNYCVIIVPVEAPSGRTAARNPPMASCKRPDGQLEAERADRADSSPTTTN